MEGGGDEIRGHGRRGRREARGLRKGEAGYSTLPTTECSTYISAVLVTGSLLSAGSERLEDKRCGVRGDHAEVVREGHREKADQVVQQQDKVVLQSQTLPPVERVWLRKDKARSYYVRSLILSTSFVHRMQMY